MRENCTYGLTRGKGSTILFSLLYSTGMNFFKQIHYLKEKKKSIAAFTQVALHQHQVFLKRLFQLPFDNLPHRLTFAE